MNVSIERPDRPNVSIEARVTRPLRNLDLEAIDAIGTAEGLSRADMIRLLLSYGTYTWVRPESTLVTGTGTHSVKLLPEGVDAVKTLAERESLPWDVMAAEVIAYAVTTWKTRWRKDAPGLPSPQGVHKRVASTPKAIAPAN